MHDVTQRTPLAQIDVHTGCSEGADWVGISGNDSDIVSGETDGEVRQRSSVDHAYPVCLACLHRHILTLASWSKKDISVREIIMLSCSHV